MRILVLFSFCVLLLWPASGQVLESARSTLDPSGGLAYEGSFVFQPPLPAAPPVLNAPFSADEIFETRQYSGGGNRIEPSQSRARILRDSQGRMRRERTLFLGPDISDPPQIVEITDVVAGYQYTLDLRHQVAHRSKLPQPGDVSALAPSARTVPTRMATAGPNGKVSVTETSATPPPPDAIATLPPSGNGPPSPQVEQLGKRAIDGIPAEGTRYTNLIPGTRPEDRPTITTAETWMSTDLRIIILSTTTHPVNGERSIRLKNLRRAEPDAVLFQVPPNYTIKDEAGEFTMQVSARK